MFAGLMFPGRPNLHGEAVPLIVVGIIEAGNADVGSRLPVGQRDQVIGLIIGIVVGIAGEGDLIPGTGKGEAGSPHSVIVIIGDYLGGRVNKLVETVEIVIGGRYLVAGGIGQGRPIPLGVIAVGYRIAAICPRVGAGKLLHPLTQITHHLSFSVHICILIHIAFL